MKQRAWLEKWGLVGLKIKPGFLEGEFAKLTIPVLNQIIRPFTAKWHRLSLAGAFEDAVQPSSRPVALHLTPTAPVD